LNILFIKIDKLFIDTHLHTRTHTHTHTHTYTHTHTHSHTHTLTHIQILLFYISNLIFQIFSKLSYIPNLMFDYIL